MASAAKQETGTVSGEYKKPDAVRAFEIYDKQIKPKKGQMDTLRGDLSDPYSLIKDQCHFPRKILDLVVFLEAQEDAKRDHMLLALSEGLKHRKLFMPRDLVTIASGDEGSEVIPAGERPKPQLVTIAGKPATGDETDLSDAADAVVAAIDGPLDGSDPKDGSDGDDGSFEAPEAELAKQAGRGKSRGKKASIDSIASPAA